MHRGLYMYTLEVFSVRFFVGGMMGRFGYVKVYITSIDYVTWLLRK